MIMNANNLFLIREENREKIDSIIFRKFAEESGDFFFFRNIMKEYLKYKDESKNDELNDWIKHHYFNKK